MNPFSDQKTFMLAAEQSVGVYNAAQTELYINLVIEEFQELVAAASLEGFVKEATDLIVVTIGLMHSLGVDPEEAWRLVNESNMSKLTDGKLVKREDGKILKPDTYKQADLFHLIMAIPGLDETDLVKTEFELEGEDERAAD